jgi:FkbM family methyltransferase
MLSILKKLGVTLTRTQNVDPQLRMDIALERSLMGVDLFVDVGANRGQTYCRVRELGYRSNYLAIEPEEKSFKVLEGLSKCDPNLSCIKSAIGAERGEVVLNVASNDALSSSVLDFSENHKNAAPGIHMVEKQEVKVRPLSDVLKNINSKRMFLKIDVQGYEMHVLRGLSEFEWTKIVGVLVECNLVASYEGSSLVEDVVAYLREHGLSPFRVENGFGSPDFGQQLQVDILFKMK